MELYTLNDGWKSMRGGVLFTSSMLHASGVHAGLARPLDVLLERWDALDAEGTQADRQVIMANARVAWLNLDLDERTEHFGAQLVVDFGDRGHKTYKAFFPNALGTVTRLALDSQLKAMEKFSTLADELTLPKGSEEALDEVLEVFPQGRDAIDARSEAERGVTRMSVKIDAWRDEANKLRRAVETALDDYANKNDLPRDYASGFFPTQKRKAAKRVPTESELVLALPDAALRALSETYVATLPAETQAAIRARLAVR